MFFPSTEKKKPYAVTWTCLDSVTQCTKLPAQQDLSARQGREKRKCECLTNATERLIQWDCGLSLGSTVVITKFVECPLVDNVPVRSSVLYSGQA